MVVVLAILAGLIVAAAVTDIRARRRRRRIRIDNSDVRNARHDNITRYNQNRPGGSTPDQFGGGFGGFSG
jgi:hypothetical protein